MSHQNLQNGSICIHSTVYDKLKKVTVQLIKQAFQNIIIIKLLLEWLPELISAADFYSFCGNLMKV